MLDSHFIGALDWVKQRVNEGLIPLLSVWWPNRPSVPIHTQVLRPEGWECSEVLMDKYVHKQNIHDCKTGRCCQAEERKIPKELAAHVLVQDMAHVRQFACKYTYVCCSKIFKRFREVHMEMPGKEDQLIRLWTEITTNEEEEGYTILQVESAQDKLEVLMLCRDTEHNCRYDKFGAAHILHKWLSCNPLTCSKGQLSFNCDLTVPMSQIKFVPFFDLAKRPGGLVSESYTSYHRW